MEAWKREMILRHSAKGTTWTNHKYVAIKNGRYIYNTGKKIKEEIDNAKENKGKELVGTHLDDMGAYTFEDSEYVDPEEEEVEEVTEENEDANDLMKKVRDASFEIWKFKHGMPQWKKEMILRNGFICHYGVSKRDGAKFGSGRYPLGSGENPKAKFTLFKKKDNKPIEKLTDTPEDKRAARKQVAIDNGDVEFVKNNLKEFTNDEIKKVTSNYETKKKLLTQAKEIEDTKDPAKIFIKKVKKGTELAETLLSAAQTIKKGIDFVNNLGNKIDELDNKNNKKKKKKK